MWDKFWWSVRVGVFAAVGLGAATVPAGEWPRFRGPNGSGVAAASGAGEAWKPPHVLWRVELPGSGHGSPVVWGEKLFLLCANDEGTLRMVQCRDVATGELVWSREFPAQPNKKHRFNSFATSTPAVDAERVYAAWGSGDDIVLAALTHAGDVAWHLPRVGAITGGHGFGTSPIVYGELVILARDNEHAGDSSLLAVRKETGEIAWQTPRPGGRLNFSTPCVYRNPHAGREELIFVAWPIGVTSVNPADGSIYWELEAFQTEKGERAVASPIVAGELLFANCAFTNGPKHLVALRGRSQGPAEVVWRVDDNSVPHIPSLTAVGERLLAWNDGGVCICYRLSDGRELWKKRVGGTYFGSPVAVGERLYCVDVDGTLVIVAAGEEYAELARIPLEDLCRSTPAVADGRMFIRTAHALTALGPVRE